MYLQVLEYFLWRYCVYDDYKERNHCSLIYLEFYD